MMLRNTNIYLRLATYLLLAVLFIGAGVGLFGGIYFRWYTAPYDPTGKTVAWSVRMPEPAYNFDTVVPGKLYRSALPDARFLDYAQQRYGIQHIVTLMGATEIEERAKELGMKVTVLNWRNDELPGQDLKLLLTLFNGDERVLVHCKAGRDRTGYAIALYRIRQQQWSVQRAIQEMESYGHSRRRRSQTNQVLLDSLDKLTDQPVGTSAARASNLVIHTPA
jgi:protein tyrosine/serine phosphatase